uniref:Uncharacterized protein n=1 Tax=Panagrolaimus sp. ES5 TaxID=591445 RepID=A0AC34FSZ6_9BILA
MDQEAQEPRNPVVRSPVVGPPVAGVKMVVPEVASPPIPGKTNGFQRRGSESSIYGGRNDGGLTPSFHIQRDSTGRKWLSASTVDTICDCVLCALEPGRRAWTPTNTPIGSVYEVPVATVAGSAAGTRKYGGKEMIKMKELYRNHSGTNSEA